MKNYEAQILEESLSLDASFEAYAPGIDNPIAILRDLNNNEDFDDDEVFFYTKDHLGSIRELVGLDGKLKQRQRYTAYGVTTREKNTDEMDRLIDHAYGFTSRELDSETGLYFYRARYYSSEMQRFVSEDTSGPLEAVDTNLYRYVRNNPVLALDPDGNKYVATICFTASFAMAAASFIDAAEMTTQFAIETNILKTNQQKINELLVKKRRQQKVSCGSSDNLKKEIKRLQNENIKALGRLQSLTSEKAKSYAIGVGLGLAAAGCALLPF